MSEVRLLVLGVGSELGSLATAFMEQHHEFADIVGIDVHPPRRRLRRTEFIRVEHAARAELVRCIVAHRPDVLVHMGVWEPHARVGTAEARVATGNYASAVCEALTHLRDLRRLVIRSGIEVYGAHPAIAPDEHSPVAPSSTYGHMLHELEAMLHESAPTSATVTTLRLAPVIGAHVPSPLGRLLRLPVVPIDPFSRARFQVVADDDAARAVAHAALLGHHGVVNVVAEQPTTVLAALRRGRRAMVPVLPRTWRIATTLTTLAGAPLPDHVTELLQHGRLATTTVHDVEYRPTHSTPDVLSRLYSWPSVVRIGPHQPRSRVA